MTWIVAVLCKKLIVCIPFVAGKLQPLFVAFIDPAPSEQKLKRGGCRDSFGNGIIRS